LYVVTRADLAPGTQACQSVHAACEFAITYPTVFAAWHHESGVLVCAAARDELELPALYRSALAAGRRAVRFTEPDLDDALTAVALEPAAHRLVRHFPLALAPPALSPVARPLSPARPLLSLVSDRPARDPPGGSVRCGVAPGQPEVGVVARCRAARARAHRSRRRAPHTKPGATHQDPRP